MAKGKPWTRKETAELAADYSALTVPVNVTFEGKQKILSLSQVEKILRGASKWIVADCECRKRVKGCDAPINVCIFLDTNKEDTDELIKERNGRIITLTEALEIIKRARASGLVNIAWAEKSGSRTKYFCSCCSCCCHAFAAMQKFGFNELLISSDMIAEQDQSLCDDCGICVDKCHFKARWMDDDKLKFEKSKCFGCGLCLPACPSNVISLANRK